MPMSVTSVSTNSLRPVVPVRPVLREGARGVEVRRLQERLDAKGYSVNVDGHFGRGTKEVVIRYQGDHALRADGVVGASTWDSLEWDSTVEPSTLPAPAIGSITVELPARGVGFRTYNRDGNDQFGTPGTIARIIELGQAWDRTHPDQPFSVGDIAMQGGGRFPPHKSHRVGSDVDLRPLSKNGVNQPMQFDNPEYDRAATRELVRLAKRMNPGMVVYFNDPVLISEGLTQFSPGHHNHLHFKMEEVRLSSAR